VEAHSRNARPVDADYFGVDLALVWTAVERDVPFLRAAIEELLI
jgi:uncharacterized protein with HEPN domain